MEEEKLEFGELCREIIRRVKREGGSMSRRDVGRSFQNNLRFGPELRRAIDHLIDTEQLIEWKEETGGRPSWWLELPPKERPEPEPPPKPREEPKVETEVRSVVFKRRI